MPYQTGEASAKADASLFALEIDLDSRSPSHLFQTFVASQTRDLAGHGGGSGRKFEAVALVLAEAVEAGGPLMSLATGSLGSL